MSKEMWYIYTMGYSSTIKNKTHEFSGKWIELQINILSEVTQTQKDKCVHFYVDINY